MSRSMRPLSRRLLSLQCRRHESTNSAPKPAHSREQVQDFLHEHDDRYLAAVKRRVESIERQTRKIAMIAWKITNDGGHIQLNPDIPAYKVAPWQKQGQVHKSLVERMLKQTERIRLNVSDLQVESYPSDSDIGGDSASVASLAKQDRDKMLLQTRMEKEDALLELRNTELAHRRRFEEGLDSFEKEVEKYRLDRQKTPMHPPVGMERKSLKENVNKARDDSKKPVKKEEEGWGSHTKITKIFSATALPKMPNPFEKASSKSPVPTSSDEGTARFSTADKEASTGAQKAAGSASANADACTSSPTQKTHNESVQGVGEGSTGKSMTAKPKNSLTDLHRQLLKAR
ncbi:hypothetical protein AC578_3686 [Pseudocercospora eumusae]|uniref:Uncharacterized protein n=1 Tax=Pseudocercospora eumusae TaxID=321146 RepID=A0A139HSS8_9PEZI|nr:hypothetical protein AC578_3686 [Pseudocercospora eumusae]